MPSSLRVQASAAMPTPMAWCSVLITTLPIIGFALSCNGTASVERVRLNKPTVLQRPTSSADVPAGAPGEVRMGVWVNGTDMHFFLNDHYQFSITDSTYASGGIGAFARSAGDTPVTVTFSDLAIYDIIYSDSTPTPRP